MATMPAVAVAVGGGGGGGVAANVVVPSHQNTVPSAPHPLMSISSQPSSTTTITTATATATTITPTINLTFSSFPPTNPTVLPPPAPAPAPANPISIPSSFYSDFVSNYSTSSSTSSDEEQEQEALVEGRRKRKRKWKWKDFFERLMKEVIQKQEDLQKKFLEAIEKREQERAVREEAWRMQEMARINREREILAQERSIAAAKDAAVMAFLQKMSEHQPPHNVNLPPPPQPPPPPPIQPVLAPPAQSAPPVPAPAPHRPPQVAPNNMEMTKADSKAEGENNLMGASSSRWPKMEVQALINLRTSLDSKYQENGPKGPLWEEISAAMRKIGYNRSSKRCKEKWENINKYFKKVKESNKKRPEDSKTCPYFHQLDALYREKNRFENVSPGQIKPENTIPLMVQPEQQWPPQQDQNNPDSGMESDPMDQNQDDEEDKDEDEEEEEGDGNYELVANRPPLPSSMSAAE